MAKETHICSTDAFKWGYAIFRVNKGFYLTLALLCGPAVIIADGMVDQALSRNDLAIILFTILGALAVHGTVILGYSTINLAVTKDEEPDAGLFFSRIGQLLGYFVAAPAFMFISLVSAIAFVLPGIYLAARLQFFPFALVEEEIGWKKALARSWELTNRKGWQVVWWSFLCQLVLYAVPLLLISVGLLLLPAASIISVVVLIILGASYAVVATTVVILSAAHIYRQLQAFADHTDIADMEQVQEKPDLQRNP